MSTQRPRLRTYTPPTPAERAALEQRAERERAQRDRDRAELRPVRIAMMHAQVQAGIRLRDPEAAADCPCSCHTSLNTLHARGVDCSCQLTPGERRARWHATLSSIADLGRDEADEADEAGRVAAAKFAALAADLNVTVTSHGGIVLYQMSGIVDGRAFYLRTRHGVYQLEIGTDEDPLTDPGTAPLESPSLIIATGDEDDLVLDGRDERGALRFAVGEVRTYLRQRHCAHADARRYCPDCGTALYPPEQQVG